MTLTSSEQNTQSTANAAAAPVYQGWRVDPMHTIVQFAVKHMMISTVRGGFHSPNGTILVDEQDLTRSRVEAVIDARTLDTHAEERDVHLRSADFLDVENHPQITFTSTRVEVLDPEHVRVLGNLTIRGVTQEVPLDVELGGRNVTPWGEQKMGFSATTKINRKDFGLNWNMALEMGGMMVGDDIKISIDGEATPL
ncbi:MAG TPA: YceI family protein [Chloroflexia bacterium]